MGWRRTAVLAVAGLCAAVSLSACPDNVDPPNSFITTTSTTAPADVDQPTSNTLGRPSALPPERKVRDDVAGLVPLLNDFWTREMQDRYQLRWHAPSAVREYDRGNEVVCGRSYLAENNAWYCPADHAVSYDISWFASYLARHPGGATTFLILAHEFGHAAQELWVRSGGGDTWNPPYRKELGADCLAGAFLIDGINRGAIIVEEGDDKAIFGWLFEGGSPSSPWLNPGSHGTRDQRQQAFTEGLRNGVDHCRKTY